MVNLEGNESFLFLYLSYIQNDDPKLQYINIEFYRYDIKIILLLVVLIMIYNDSLIYKFSI